MKLAYSNFLGNNNNALQTSKSVNRVELINSMQRVIMYLRKELNISKDVQNINRSTSFPNISHESSVKQISGYCNLADLSSKEEVTSNLEGKATRDYTASILVKVLNCLKSEIEETKK